MTDAGSKFVDLSGNNNADIEALFGLNETSNLKPQLDKVMIQACSARDRFEKARVQISKTNLLLMKEAAADNPAAWEQLKRLPDAPMPTETRVMNELCKMATGECTLKEIFDKYDQVPRAVLWPAAALLLETRMTKLSAIKVFAK